jgi:proliferating cell nuclear antigen
MSSAEATVDPYFAIDADTLRDALDPVTALVNECKIHLDGDGWRITAVDPANVGMIDLEIGTEAFDGYTGDGEVIGVNLDRLTDVLSMADGDDTVDIELDTETRKLGISIGGLSYTLALINPDSIRQEPDIPDLNLPATYVAEGRELSRAVTAADLCSDHVEMRGPDGDTFEIVAEGDTDDVEVTIDGEGLLSGAHTGEGPVESLFSLDYLEDMAQPIGADTEVSVVLGSEMPVKLRYSLADGRVSVVNMLAPRVQSE